MNPVCKTARQYIKQTTLDEYNEVVKRSKLTPTQEEILRRHIILRESIAKISFALHISERPVKQNLSQCYQAIGKIIGKDQ